MRGEMCELPKGRRSCGSSKLRPLEKTFRWGERTWIVLFVWPPMDPVCGPPHHSFRFR